jgi:hypothetical protein
VEQHLAWLADRFGEQVLPGRVMLPTDEFSPGAHRGDDAAVRRVFAGSSARTWASWRRGSTSRTAWARYVDANPRAYPAKGPKYLQAGGRT